METIYSQVTIREPRQEKKVKIGSILKPEIVSEVIQKWQSLIDLMAEMVKVPSGLIMKLNEETIEVFLASQTAGNPYKQGATEKLIYGLYCETVIGTQKQLLVPDATKSLAWKSHNPDIELNMISYLGLPINWPDGEVFGTVCLLDNKENFYNDTFKNFLINVKQNLETDLQLLVTNNELEKLNQIKSRFLSLISHDIRGNISTVDEIVKYVLSEFDNYDNAQLKEILTTVSQSLGATFSTLEELLKWSKNDLMKLNLQITQFSVSKMFDELLEYYKQALSLKNISVHKEYSIGDDVINADENLVKTSFRNLLSNAIKYNVVDGKIYIRLKKIENKLIVEIEDSGKGLDRKIIDLLNSPNKYVDGNINDSSTGLGLYMTMDFLEKNNASLKIDSVIGEGSKFEITFYI